MAKNLISWSWGDFSVFPLLTMASAKREVKYLVRANKQMNNHGILRSRAGFQKTTSKLSCFHETTSCKVFCNCAGRVCLISILSQLYRHTLFRKSFSDVHSQTAWGKLIGCGANKPKESVKSSREVKEFYFLHTKKVK